MPPGQGYSYQITIPGQGKFRIDSPTELTDEQAFYAASQQADMLRMANPATGMSTGAKVAAGAGKAVADAWQGLKQIGGFASDQEVADTRARDAALMDTGAGKVGNFLGNVGMAVPASMVPGANTYLANAAVGGLLGAVQPTIEGESRTLNTALGAGGGVVGKYLGDKAANYVATRLADRTNALASEQAANAVRDATLKEAQAAGYVVPPTAVNPSVVNSVVEGIGGKIKTAQGASFKNQEVTNALAKKAIGLAPDDPLTRASLASVRDQAGGAYKAVQGLQSVNWDQAFERSVKGLVPSGAGAVKNPARDGIDDLVEGLLKKGAWTGSELVEDIKLLREMGHSNVNAASRAGGDTAKSMLGKAQLKASSFLEDLAERNLANNKAPASTIQDLKAARELIAKTYTVEKALDEATGNVSAHVVANLLRKGKPLTGELELIGKTGAAFGKFTQPAEKIGSANPLSAVDAFASMGLGSVGLAGSDSPYGAALGLLPLLRPGARSLALSGMYQRGMVGAPNYAPGLLHTAPDALMWNPLGQRLPAAAGAAGGLLALPQ